MKKLINILPGIALGLVTFFLWGGLQGIVMAMVVYLLWVITAKLSK